MLRIIVIIRTKSSWRDVPMRGRYFPRYTTVVAAIAVALSAALLSPGLASAASANQAPPDKANAQLKVWKILTKLRCCPWRAGKLAKAIHALQLHGA